MKYDVVGIGNSILDLTVEVKDSFIQELGFAKGSMTLINKETADKILGLIQKYTVEFSAGGSCANSISALSIVGGKAGFIGVIGDDDYGSQYAHKTIQTGVVGHFCKRKSMSTGFAITMITEDGERTFATYIEEKSALKQEDVDGFKDMLNTKYLCLEGYMLLNPQIRSVLENCISITKKHGGKIVLDVSAAFVVTTLGATLKNFVNDYVDVLFLNESEAEAFSGIDAEEAISVIGKFAETVIIKIGAKGSIIKKENTVIKYPSSKVEVVNTNGAGDAFAGGFLFGLSKDLSLELCAKYGTYCAKKVIEQVPARLHYFNKEEFSKL